MVYHISKWSLSNMVIPYIVGEQRDLIIEQCKYLALRTKLCVQVCMCLIA